MIKQLEKIQRKWRRLDLEDGHSHDALDDLLVELIKLLSKNAAPAEKAIVKAMLEEYATATKWYD